MNPLLERALESEPDLLDAEAVAYRILCGAWFGDGPRLWKFAEAYLALAHEAGKLGLPEPDTDLDEPEICPCCKRPRGTG